MALPCSRTPSLEALDGSPGPDAPEQPHPVRPPPCEIGLEPDVEHSMDIILVDAAGPSAPVPPRACRDLLVFEVKANGRDIEDLCLCCGRPQVHTQHPLFEGGMCAPCKDRYLDSLFLYDDDGYQALCSVCGAGETLLVCESPDCTRCYCFECVDALDGPLETFKTVPAWKRQPVRVLSVFGDIRKELTSLGFLETGSDPGRFRHLEDVTDVVRRDVEGWGPFDLVFGSTPPAGHACARPPGWYLFQFHRLLQYARPRPGSPRPFFWMFVDSLALGEDSQDVATRFLEASSVTVQDSCGRDSQGAVRVWSNIPAMRRHVALAPEEEPGLPAPLGAGGAGGSPARGPAGW